MLEHILPERLIGFVVADSSEPRWTAKFNALNKLLGKGIIAGLVGKCGTGKSQMAVSLAKFAIHEQRTALMVEAMELCDSVKDTFGGDESSKQVLYKYLRPSLLVIDEMNQGLSQYDARLIQRVLSRRFDSMRDTILISNETPEAFCGIVGDRIVSRINDTGGVHEFDWRSFRK